MLRTIIIDDEPLVIEGLNTMVDWQGHGFRVCGVAEDGEKGLEAIEKLQPDVVFTDVRMPGMDGLSLVKQYINSHNKPIFFVILTGFSEFDYIKKAMDLNVVDYLLKPIEPENVHRILDYIRVEYNRRLDIEQKLEQDIKNVTRLTLTRLLEEQPKESLLQRGRFLLRMDQNNGYIYLRCSKNIKKLLDDIELNEMGLESITIEEKELQESRMVWGQEQSLNKWRNRVETIFYEQVKSNHAYLYLAKPSNDLKQLREIHKQIQTVEKNRFYDAYSFLTIDINEPIRFRNELTIFEKNQVFGKYILSDQETVVFELNKLFHDVYVNKIDPELVRLRYELFLEKMKNKMDGVSEKVEINTFSQFKSQCLGLVKQYFHEKEHTYTGLDIEEVKTYIIQHMSGDLKLKTVAKHFGYNSIYMGQYFTRQSGKKFRDYVLELRMEKAKEMLLHTNATVNQITVEIGFRDRDYFVKKFKEKIGCLPSEYRDEKKNEKNVL